ncbi:DUF2793 domain-containing protein [Phreatobacter sp. AB_2022a]|uniref:DUF2793 domain-containing protein n=1 Tax=Phreatobacter sp. AB_2022a TaxID=3003134 RepID=UPI002286F4D0|nr:DUF2793 domain-containing protein [Phreatobacter sp. AB_2022a]MCZ0734600.1 DUF2793 domain-containing protein [Phreatobacter sp. AB_2022a]
MSYDKLLAAEPGVWTITLTQNSRTASVAGILPVTAGAREGDAVLDDEGRILVIKALTETEVTLAWPYKAATRTIDLVVEQRSINRAINTASSTAAIAALTRLQNAADLAPNYPVLSHGNTPPAAPADGDRHLVGIDPTGAWAGRAEHLALYSAATGKWSFTPPQDGMSVVLAGTSARLQYNGTAWGIDALGATGGRLTGPLDWASAVDVASAPTVDLGAVNSNLVNITGATAIAAFGTAANGVWRLVRFADALVLTHGASLALPSGANIVTATGDWALLVSGDGVWQCAGYTRADGTPLSLGAGTVTTTKLVDAAVTNAKLADMAAGTIKLRALAAGSGPPIDGTPAQARAIVQVIDPTPSLIVNGAMQHSQEYGNTAVPITGTGAWPYIADQMYVATVGAGIGITVQRVAAPTPGGATNRLRLTVTTAKAAVAAGDFMLVQQTIEAQALAGTRFGSSGARRLLGSFMFRGPAGTYGWRYASAGGARCFLGTFTITSAQANTDTLQTISIDPDAIGPWILTGAGAGAAFSVTLACGANFFGTLGWNTADTMSTAAQINGLGSTSNVFEIGDIDLYPDISGIGSVRPFVVPDPAAELLRCLRYYEKSLPADKNPGSPTNLFNQYPMPNGGMYATVRFKVQMRASPTVSIYDTAGNVGRITYYDTDWRNGGNYSWVLANENALFVQANIVGGLIGCFEYVAKARM